MENKTNAFLIFVVVLMSGAVAYLNLAEQKAVDRSKLPEKVENSRGFQRWITNLKNKGYEVEADEFRLEEENEIYNTKWLKISSIDEDAVKEEFEVTIESYNDTEKTVFSPSERALIDWRMIERGDYEANEVRYYGLRDDKVLDSRIVDCSTRSNCYFDRAYFLDNSNDTFVVSEFSMDFDDDEFIECSIDEECNYTIKLHVVDLINNSRLVYKSQTKILVLSEVIPEL